MILSSKRSPKAVRANFLWRVVVLGFVIGVCGIETGAQAQSTAALDAQNGFFDVTLGDSLSQLPGQYIGREYVAKKDRYRRADQAPDIAGVPVSKVFYSFYKQRLHSITIRVEGDQNAKDLLAVLELLYGPGVQDGFAPFYDWKGKKVHLSYEQNMLTKNAEVVFRSIPVQDQMDADYSKIIMQY